MGKTLNEAFAELIKKRRWYAYSFRVARQAKEDKAKFLKGKVIPEHRIREYLKSAGWEPVQNELWEEKNPKSFGKKPLIKPI